jgi:hypothetical protein
LGAGETNQPVSSIIINATDAALNASNAGFYVNPIRNVAGSMSLTYNPDTSEISYTTGGGGGGTALNTLSNVAIGTTCVSSRKPLALWWRTMAGA